MCPLLTKNFFNRVEFSIIPLWTTETLCEECGWALTLFGKPWVAHLTCPIPIEPWIVWMREFFSRSSTLTSDLISLIVPSESVAIPAESYPLYSNFFNEFIIAYEPGLLLLIPIIPHIIFYNF